LTLRLPTSRIESEADRKGRTLPAYAIVRSGGKQYRVQEGDTIEVERLPTPEGERVELLEVLLLAEDGRVTVGAPTVSGVKVVADVVSHGRNRKVTVFRYKAKTRYRRKTGHRQAFTRLAIQRIQVGEEEERPKRRRRARKAAVEEPVVGEAVAPEEPAVGEAAGPEEPVVGDEVASEEPAVGEAPAPKTEAGKKPAPRRRRKTADTPPAGE
jgi:large subunit ribosomal protein L21